MRSLVAPLLFTMALVGGVAGGTTASSATTERAAAHSPLGVPPPEVVTRAFDGTFIPTEVVAASSSIWLVGENAGTGNRCRLGRLDPQSMALTTYRLPLCGMNVAAGQGAIYLEAAVADAKTDTYAIHVERFAIASAQATVDPTATSIFLGSDLAHTQFAFANGWLWLFTGQEIMKISPTTGAIVRRFTSVLNPGGVEPLIVGQGDNVWFAGGAGSGDSAQFLRIDVSSGAMRTVTLPGRYASVYALSSIGDRLLFMYVAYGPKSKAPIDSTLTDHIGEFLPSGRLVAESKNQATPSTIAQLPSGLYGIGPASDTCTTTRLAISLINPDSLRTQTVASLTTPGESCVGQSGFRPSTVLGNEIFVLYGTQDSATVYRVMPHDH